MSDHSEYYKMRALTERRRAAEAGRAEVAAIHMELAEQYQALIDQAELREAIRLTPSLVRAPEA